MATTYKPITNNDVASTKTLLHEAIPITGTIVSGTYTTETSPNDELNIKNYSHGMFPSVYDYPYLSSSANHIFDITVGYSDNSNLSASTSTMNNKKINIYNQMAQVLVGYDVSGSVLDFDRAGDLSTAGTKLRECFFVNFARLLSKDEIKKQSFTLTAYTGGAPTNVTDALTISDYGSNTTFKTNSPAGEYGILYTGSQALADTGIGLLYYQAGVAVLSASIFDGEFGIPTGTHTDQDSVDAILTGSNISSSCDGLRNRWKDLSFNNTTELNSTIYFCRINHNEFNYSSNPTYLSASQIRVKNNKADAPISYITTVGLYSSDNELMGIAKLSEPLKKDPANEFTLRVRLDY